MSWLAKTCHSLFFAVFLVLTAALPAQAGGGGGASGPEPLRFTVNLGKTKYLQVEMVLVGASPAIDQQLAALRPRVQHQIILLLTEQQPDRLFSREGKHVLIADIIDTVNRIIDENEKTGVHEVLFTSFIIQ